MGNYFFKSFTSQRIFKKSRNRPINKQTIPMVRNNESFVEEIKLIPTRINRIETAYRKAAKENEMIRSSISKASFFIKKCLSSFSFSPIACEIHHNLAYVWKVHTYNR